MKSRHTGIIITLLVIIIIGLLLWKISYVNKIYNNQISSVSTTTAILQHNATNTETMITDGIITLMYSPSEFDLSSDWSLYSYIPPCNSDVDHCLVYNSKDYENTNFGSAGISIKKRSDISDEKSCVEKSPAWDIPPKPFEAIGHEDGYSVSRFNESGAAMSHSADSTLYRLFYFKDSSCYEFKTTISEDVFDVYKESKQINELIKEFDVKLHSDLLNKLFEQLEKVSLPNGQSALFGALYSD